MQALCSFTGLKIDKSKVNKMLDHADKRGDFLNALRSDTPGIKGRLHLDNCGSSLMPMPVIDAVKSHFALEAEVGGYVAQERHQGDIEYFYDRLACLLGGDQTEYAFTPSAVEAWVRAFYSVPMHEGDNIVTAFNEYCANYIAYVHQARRRGVEIRTIGANKQGQLDLDALAAAVDDRTRLISISLVPSSSGQINDVAAVGRIARRAEVMFLLDACQSIGQLPVNVAEIGCDMLTGTGRKFLRGPRGTGFLYVSHQARERLDPVFLTNASGRWVDAPDQFDMRDDARIFEGWERNIAGMLGLSAALGYLLDNGVERLTSRLQHVARTLRSGLAALPNTEMTCPAESDAAIITFSVDGHSADDVKKILEAENIAVQIARAEHTRIDLQARGIESVVRVSPHYFTSEEEIDRFLQRIRGFAQ